VVYLAQAVSEDLDLAQRRGHSPAEARTADPVDPVPLVALGIEPERYLELLVTTQQRYALLSVRFG
jgi:hypothetical protein